MKKALLVAIAAAALVLASPAGPCFALRCGDNIIDVGSTADEVMQSCGKPLEVKSETEHKEGQKPEDRLHPGTSVHEQWVYNFNDGWITTVWLLDGVVEKITFTNQ
ncbi:MAG: DUF2845 domain-containing protein [Thermodesulfobacteriota bacterium]